MIEFFFSVKGFKTFLKMYYKRTNGDYKTEKKMLILLKIRDKSRHLNMLQQYRVMWKVLLANINLRFNRWSFTFENLNNMI
jgi:hypothetical protein